MGSPEKKTLGEQVTGRRHGCSADWNKARLLLLKGRRLQRPEPLLPIRPESASREPAVSFFQDPFGV